MLWVSAATSYAVQLQAICQPQAPPTIQPTLQGCCEDHYTNTDISVLYTTITIQNWLSRDSKDKIRSLFTCNPKPDLHTSQRSWQQSPLSPPNVEDPKACKTVTVNTRESKKVLFLRIYCKSDSRAMVSDGTSGGFKVHPYGGLRDLQVGQAAEVLEGKQRRDSCQPSAQQAECSTTPRKTLPPHSPSSPERATKAIGTKQTLMFSGKKF